MYVDMTCGPCQSTMTMDYDEDMDTVTLDLVHRFTQAHVACGYIAPSINPDAVEVKQRKVQNND